MDEQFTLPDECCYRKSAAAAAPFLTVKGRGESWCVSRKVSTQETRVARGKDAGVAGKFAQMQMQQYQQLVGQQRELLAKEQLSRHQQIVQWIEQLEQRGEEGLHLVQQQKLLKENLSGLQERVYFAQSEWEQQFSDLKEEVLQVQTNTSYDVSLVKEELLCSQQEIGWSQ